MQKLQTLLPAHCLATVQSNRMEIYDGSRQFRHLIRWRDILKTQRIFAYSTMPVGIFAAISRLICPFFPDILIILNDVSSVFKKI